MFADIDWALVWTIVGAVGSVVGAVATVAVAWAVVLWQSRHSFKAELAARLERRKQLSEALRNTIIDNIEIIEKMTDGMQDPVNVLVNNIDLAILDSTSSLKYDVLGDIDLCRRLDSVRGNLRILHRKLDLLQGLEFNPLARTYDDPRTQNQFLRFHA